MGRTTSFSCFDPNSDQEYSGWILPNTPLAACSVLRPLFSSHCRAHVLTPMSLRPQNLLYFGNKVNPAEWLHFVKFSGNLQGSKVLKDHKPSLTLKVIKPWVQILPCAPSRIIGRHGLAGARIPSVLHLTDEGGESRGHQRHWNAATSPAQLFPSGIREMGWELL